MKPMKFSLKMAVEDMPDEEYKESQTAVHFGVPWFLGLHREEDYLDVYLKCSRDENAESPWSIDVTFKIRFASAMREIRKEIAYFCEYSKNVAHGKHKFMRWQDAIEGNTADSTAMVYCDVTITKMTGIAPKRQRSFEEPEEHLTDVVLTVGEEKFHVAKVILAAQSSYFKTLFFGNFNEAKKPKIELKDVDADVFQVILEIIYGRSQIKAGDVANLLELADKFDVPLVRQRCEEYLQETVDVDKKEKLRLADVFKLENLMRDCMAAMETPDELKAFLPANLTDLSHSTLAALFEKNLLQC